MSTKRIDNNSLASIRKRQGVGPNVYKAFSCLTKDHHGAIGKAYRRNSLKTCQNGYQGRSAHFKTVHVALTCNGWV